ncbi:MAG: alpha/beta fold hydrolase [Janthinobacterium lividum]
MKPSRSTCLSIRTLRYHLRHWGREGAPKLFMLHGWMDVSASFQFVVDSLQQDWHVIAPDWRGFGETAQSGLDTYWFADYMADLDAILEHHSGDRQVNLIGHSMGGNVAMNYAGVRPQRVARLVNLEGFGLPATTPDQAPMRQADWLAQLRKAPSMKTYPSLQAVAARLQKTNPRLSDERAQFLAPLWAKECAEGSWQIRADARHKGISPLLYQLDETEALWRNITAPVLWIEAEDTRMLRALGQAAAMKAELLRRTGWLRQCCRVRVADAGHMLHHDQPDQVAALIERFLAS